VRREPTPLAEMVATLCEPFSRFSLHKLQEPLALDNLQEELALSGQQAQQVGGERWLCDHQGEGL